MKTAKLKDLKPGRECDFSGYDGKQYFATVNLVRHGMVKITYPVRGIGVVAAYLDREQAKERLTLR